nr:MAG TPA: hypothetical protein [Caudoviricetes sp.]
MHLAGGDALDNAAYRIARILEFEGFARLGVDAVEHLRRGHLGRLRLRLLGLLESAAVLLAAETSSEAIAVVVEVVGLTEHCHIPFT